MLSNSPCNSATGPDYYIRNAHSGLYLDVDHAGTTSGTNMIQYGLTGDPNQRWRIYGLGNGYYALRPAHASGLALDVLQGGTTSGVGVWNLGTANTSSIRTSSQWKLYYSSSGGVIIKSRCSNDTMALEVYNANMNSGADVTQYYHVEDATRNDEWVLEPIHWFTGNNALTWSLSSQAVEPTGSQEYMFVPQRGILWFDFYNSYPQKVMKSTVDCWFTQSNINEIIRRYNLPIAPLLLQFPQFFDFDVTSHRSGSENLSPLSAYAVVTNIPNPKIDIEDDSGDAGSSDTDSNYEESEVACLSPGSLVAGKQYVMTTYWYDYRAGVENDSGWITVRPEMSHQFPSLPGGDLNPAQDAKTKYSMA